MNEVDRQYLDVMRQILENGEQTTNRTGIDTLSIFGVQSRFNLADGLPMLTTKKIHAKSFIHELIWFLAGRTDVKYLQDNGVRIWNEWANTDGELVSCYGKQWARWEGVDFGNSAEVDGKMMYGIRKINQITYVVNELKTNPHTRRAILSAWNPNEIEMASLPWCHAMVQFKVSGFDLPRQKLNCAMTQRSADWFLGVPANWMSYAILTHMIAQVCDLDVGEFVHHAIDTHLYINHIEQAKEQLTRTPYELSKLWLNPEIKNINDFKYLDFRIDNYVSHQAIKASVAI
jgi:thymidylate synthase